MLYRARFDMTKKVYGTIILVKKYEIIIPYPFLACHTSHIQRPCGASIRG